MALSPIASPVRSTLEVLGVAAYAVVHYPMLYLYALGSSPEGVRWIPYWTVLALGYFAMLGIALLRPGPLARVGPRVMLDAWLLSVPLAVVGALVMVVARWPLAFDGWDAHGMGADGGEANSVLFPWLHALLWVIALAYMGSRYPATDLDGPPQ